MTDKTVIKGGVGEAIPHDSATLHVSGEAVYTDDIREPQGCLHAYVLQSPYAHARIRKIDISECYSDGVHAVITAADIPGINDVAPVFSGDPVFAEDEVFYAGQAVLAVAATTRELARKAAHKAVIEYEELPALLNVRDAIKAQSFVGETCTMQIGDSTAGIEKAAHRLQGELEIGGQDHFYLEGQIAMATPQESGDMHCWSSTQHPSEVQHLIARVLGLSDHAVTVDVRRMGGAFGGKESQASLIACIAALLASKTGSPVKLRLDRDDDMTLTGKRHPFHAAWKVGFDEQGRIEGIEIDLAANCGMSADLSNAVVDRAMFHSDNAYYLGNARVTAYRCKTNMVSHTAFRGFGGPQGLLVIENIIDEIARYLGKDPLAVRKINLYDAAGALENRCTTHYGMTVEDNILPDILARLEATGEYARRIEDIRTFNDRNRILKKGIALTPVKFGISFTLKMLNQAGALIHVYKDGSIHLNHGGTEMGQGLHTKVAQVVAAEFNVDISRVKITATSTGKVPNTSATAASSGSDLNGKAAQAAARIIKERLVDFAARHFDVEKDAIRFEKEGVRIGSQLVNFAELVSHAYENRVSLSSTGYYRTPKLHWDKEAAKGRPFFYFAYGAAISEVIIDTLTGEYNILRTDILHDVGNSLNPAIDIGQIEGGFVQGTGWLTSEELYWDEKGVLKTHAPSTYKIPTSRDIPDDFRVALFDRENQENTVYRSKAVGEPPLMLSVSVFLAIKDAIAATGKGPIVLNAPATPEEVLRAITKARSAS
ncbi:xanthine dehydrogenase molybdopterin binding subunit [Ignavibacteria bacterium CHB1]|nr:MAG: xanthine dehydrogenase molybdopterin binding subunit [Chlorobiota bacterium]MBV6398620.1 putative xanthine dehydrogenase subunit D [Ignavibacteria bacterium]MCC6885212.1 xanthine dehydrogenase molybdopterin binding subunit [Ignavibacteriales bacterium]MCE7951997.1 xanthine dehydrogenase molybdopterin binding subunit [Chlorobi bacterium CHB7]MDL1886444.1 xanthine dehydrogenase molybdopterin binding subunit [Ignavibacteria bacterium CHB1]RIK48889.1 MAG: xanthine dehydrogenase molybdopter